MERPRQRRIQKGFVLCVLLVACACEGDGETEGERRRLWVCLLRVCVCLLRVSVCVLHHVCVCVCVADCCKGACDVPIILHM